ncbi:MAG: 5-formyltetrahydrofolate cyclo-ligase [Pseudobutyrivibrio sp.]|nr:5-formyltetrahydrofolate cyclo-ligase [Pseudobutyrivibrio sp.]
MEKSQNNSLRQEYKRLRDSLSPEERFSKSQAIKDKFLALLESDFKGANIFLCFYPFGSEVDLTALYEHLLKLGKDLYFPVSNVSNHKLTFRQVKDMNVDFKAGAYGIMEPKDNLNDLSVDILDKIVVITPGLIFDKALNRIGYGAGYYDRFFASCSKTTIKVGVGFDFQVTDELEVTSLDVPMDYIITNNCILKGAKL